MPNPVPIFIDTNFFFIPFRFKVDIFAEFDRILDTSYEPILLSSVLEELKNIHEKAEGKKKREASAVMELAKRCKMIKSSLIGRESVDDLILRVAKEYNAVVATNDKALRHRLKQEGVRVLYLRAKSHLEIL